MEFESLSLCEPLLRALDATEYHVATPIQQKAIPPALKGRDVVACAQTGTGKTAAFALPTLERLRASVDAPTGAARRRRRSGRRVIRALVLAPTRELAGQIGDSFATYGQFTELRHAVVYGGVRQGSQVRAIQSGIEILVATPGRLLDLMGQGLVDLGQVEILILDEADRMLDMGFIHDLRKIVAQVPTRRQTLMFSATMPAEIRELARVWLRRPSEVQVAPVASTPDRVTQAVYFVERPDKAAALTWLLDDTPRGRTLVFSRTKRGADKIARFLKRDGIRAVAIHGDKSQARRQAIMREFNAEGPPVLVATDLAARGLDFSDVSHVVNYELPDEADVYVHRIGRTARAGASGVAVSFCASDERPRLEMIEKLTRRAIAVKRLPGPAASDRSTAPSLGARPSASRRAGATDEKKRQGKRRRRGKASSKSAAASHATGSKRRKTSQARKGGNRT